jgi:hypothetical protein
MYQASERVRSCLGLLLIRSAWPLLIDHHLFRAEEFLTAVNDYRRVFFKVIQVRGFKGAVRMDAIAIGFVMPAATETSLYQIVLIRRPVPWRRM